MLCAVCRQSQSILWASSFGLHVSLTQRSATTLGVALVCRHCYQALRPYQCAPIDWDAEYQHTTTLTTPVKRDAVRALRLGSPRGEE